MNSRLSMFNKEGIIYALILLSFYFLNYFSPFINDDFYYSFIMTNGLYSDMEYTPVDNLGDIWESQCWAYQNHNGRFLAHSIVQLFCGILGLRVFQFVNSLVFLLLIIGLVRIVRQRYCVNSTFDILLPLILLFIAIPKLGMTYLGNISCSVNYLWTSCVVIWYLSFLITRGSASTFLTIVLFVFSILVGAMQESFSIGMACMLGLCAITRWRNLTSIKRILIIGFILGSIIVICAPSNFLRFTSEQGGDFSLYKMLLQCVRVALSLRAFWVMSLILCCQCLFSKKGFRGILLDYWWIFGVCVINVLFAALVAMTGKHQLVSIELFSIIFIMCSIYDKFRSLITKYSKQLTTCAIVIFCILYIPAFYYRRLINAGQESIIKQSITHNGGIIDGSAYEQLCVSQNGFVKKYTRQDNYHSFNKKGLSLCLTNGSNIRYVSSVLPEQKSVILAICTDDNQVAENVYKDSEYSFYVLRFPSVELEDIKYVVGLKPGFIGRMFYSGINGKGNHIDEREGWARECNYFEEDSFIYAIVQDTSPIQYVKVK